MVRGFHNLNKIQQKKVLEILKNASLKTRFKEKNIIGQKTWFKKGDKHCHYIDGRGKNPKLRKRKIVNGKSMLMSHFVWCNQPENLSYVPRGFVIHHLDGNGFNDNPNNLLLMPDRLHRSWHILTIQGWAV